VTEIHWGNSSSIGVRLLDQQHDVLFEAINELGVAIANGARKEELHEQLARLLDFTCRHFYAEEVLMERYEYPEREKHVNEHQHMMLQIEDAARAMEHGEPAHLRSLTGFLRRWFTTHMDDSDQECGEWLTRQGIE
jgi:hemerythrin-like metal-binding protein